MKKLLAILLCTVTVVLFCIFVGTSGAVSDDPADSYEPEFAEYEDSSISMWFDHSFRKNFTGDKTPTDMNTYSVYMAKNEIESAQFVLYSETDKLKMSAEITDFTDGSGNTVPAEIYYEMYVTASGVNRDNILGGMAENPIIRSGEIPDPVAPLANIKTFKLNAGKSQAFLIRLKTSENSVSGWYSARLNIYDSEGRQVKTATVYAYVWDFVIPEETTFQSSFFINNDISYGGSYKAFYDYFLENRLCAMDIPGGLTSDNPYLLNPRVNSVRVTSHGGGASGYYMDKEYDIQVYDDIYCEMRSSDIWEDIKDKFYFYTSDEPVCGLTWMPWTGWDIDRTKSMGYAVKLLWPGAQLVVPHHDNTPYPDAFFTSPLSNYPDYMKKDANQEMLETGCTTVWCPMTYAFTPRALINYYGGNCARNLDGFISGVYYPNGVDNNFTRASYDWESIYGKFYDRVMSVIKLKNAEGDLSYKMWEYGCGNNDSYTYCNHLIENTGLQTKLLFWQAFQNDVTGYLYYGTNNWNEYGSGADNTVTGAKATCTWFTNRSGSVYGNGMLFYGSIMGRVANVDLIGSVRVELLRDSVEEYEMLTMLSKYKSDDKAKEIVSLVSRNPAQYLSLNNFSTSAWSPDMDEYDIMAQVRKELGNEVEAAVLEGICTHNWEKTGEKSAATCLKMGQDSYKCTLCGEEKTEKTPTLHAVGECFIRVGGTDATCTENGNEIYQCTICGYKKTVTPLAYHSDVNYYNYSAKNDSIHNIICKKCNKSINADNHTVITDKKKPTCTESGYEKERCLYCNYIKSETESEPTGHSYTNGICTVCGEREYQFIIGDTDHDGKITAKDVNILKQMVIGTVDTIPEGDMNGDGKITGADVNALKYCVIS